MYRLALCRRKGEKTIRTFVILVVCFCISESMMAGDSNSNLVDVLVSFRNGPDPKVMTPVYFLARDDKLHEIPNPDVAVHFWGPNWSDQIQWWGDKQGRPIHGHLRDSMRLKGLPITTNTTWLVPFRSIVVGAEEPRHLDEEEEGGSIIVNGHAVSTVNGVADEASIRAATPNMTDGERNRFRLQANQRAGLANAMKARQNNNQALPKQNAVAEYEKAQQAIKVLDSRLGRRSRLVAFAGVPGEVFILYADGNLSVPIRAGVIDEAEFKNAERTAKKLGRQNIRMNAR